MSSGNKCRNQYCRKSLGWFGKSVEYDKEWKIEYIVEKGICSAWESIWLHRIYPEYTFAWGFLFSVSPWLPSSMLEHLHCFDMYTVAQWKGKKFQFPNLNFQKAFLWLVFISNSCNWGKKNPWAHHTYSAHWKVCSFIWAPVYLVLLDIECHSGFFFIPVAQIALNYHKTVQLSTPLFLKNCYVCKNSWV